ncbi:MAG: alpha/beta fold hydrolase [Chlorobiaceae bacterium]|nr:alpha/beta fold hydrolase [Chlorobiaceae bacterium]
MLTCRRTKRAPSERDGYAVVLLHAFPLSSGMWKQQLDALENASIATIAPNAYGIEGSEKQESWTFAQYARDLADLLDRTGCRKATIAGLSMGGYQAFEFWRRFPERTASLVLCDTRAEADAPEAAMQRQEFINAVIQRGAGEAADRMMPNYFTPDTVHANPELVERTKALITAQSVTAITSAMKAIMGRADATALLHDISCPVLVMNGREDRLTTSDTATQIAESIPGATIELIGNAAHLSNLERPEEFNRALLDHIRQVTTA